MSENPAPETLLEVGTYVSFTERGRTRYGQVVDIPAQRGRPACRGLRYVLAEDIPEGMLVQPAKWGEGGMVAKKGKRARPFSPPAPFDSGIPCANRRGEPAVILPQCDGRQNAESVLRSTPRKAEPAREESFVQLLGEMFGEDGTKFPDFSKMEEMDRRLRQAMDLQDHYLCRSCAGSLFGGGGRAVASERTGMLHSIRPDVR